MNAACSLAQFSNISSEAYLSELEMPVLIDAVDKHTLCNRNIFVIFLLVSALQRIKKIHPTRCMVLCEFER